jgi:hypothetical protein
MTCGDYLFFDIRSYKEVTMSKKLKFAGLLALVLAIAVTGVALAAPGDGDPGNPPGPGSGPGRGGQWPPRLMGEITAIGDDQFTIDTLRNDEVVVLVDEATNYLGSLTSLSGLQVGDEVAVGGERSEEEGTILAHVVVLGDDLPLGIQFGGEVTAVTASTITVEGRNGETLSFTTNSSTDYLSREGEIDALANIAAGDHVMVLFSQSSSGTLLANVIMVAGDPPAETES